MNFHDNSKNKNFKIDFSFDSALCTSFMKMEAILEGGGLHILTWDMQFGPQGPNNEIIN